MKEQFHGKIIYDKEKIRFGKDVVERNSRKAQDEGGSI